MLSCTVVENLMSLTKLKLILYCLMWYCDRQLIDVSNMSAADTVMVAVGDGCYW